MLDTANQKSARAAQQARRGIMTVGCWPSHQLSTNNAPSSLLEDHFRLPHSSACGVSSMKTTTFYEQPFSQPSQESRCDPRSQLLKWARSVKLARRSGTLVLWFAGIAISDNCFGRLEDGPSLGTGGFAQAGKCSRRSAQASENDSLGMMM